ncbi:hypothetical protein ACFLX7_05315, partial [Chloroflexota bacterium]
YRIARTGETYLNKLGNWYPGDVYEIAKEVAEASRLIFWWGDKVQGRELYTQIYWIAAPFETASDYAKIDRRDRPTPGITVRNSLIIVQKPNAYQAAIAICDYGLRLEDSFAQVLVDEGLVRWAKSDKV